MRVRILLGVALLSWSAYRLITILASNPAVAGELDAALRRWWPLLIVAVGLTGLLRLVDARQSLRGPALLVTLGAALLLITTRSFDEGWAQAALPLAVLPLGWYLVTPRAQAPTDNSEGNWPREVCVVDSRYKVNTASQLTHGTVHVILGGLVLDLRPALVRGIPGISWSEEAEGHGARLELTAVCGGIDVIVPPTWEIVLDQRERGGRCRNRVPAILTPEEMTGRLEIKALVVLGGIDIRATG